MTAFFRGEILSHHIPNKEQRNRDGNPRNDPDHIAFFADLLFFFYILQKRHFVLPLSPALPFAGAILYD